MKIDKSKSAASKSAAKKTKGASRQAGADFAAELARLHGGDANASVESSEAAASGAAGRTDPLAGGAVNDMAGVLALQEAATSQNVGGPNKVGQVQAVGKVDAVDDALSGRRRARVRAEALIESLEEIRLGLLLGAIPLDQMVELAKMAINAQDDIDDPALIKLLQEIELRSLIEIAKYAPELLDEAEEDAPADKTTGGEAPQKLDDGQVSAPSKKID